MVSDVGIINLWHSSAIRLAGAAVRLVSRIETPPPCPANENGSPNFFLGNGEGEFHGCSVHNPNYDFNDELIRLGSDCWVKIVQGCLS